MNRFVLSVLCVVCLIDTDFFGMAVGDFGNWTTPNGVHHLQKRSSFQLCYQMDQTVGPSCLAYVNYGCFCGIGNKGRPVDAIDRCCEAHDNCYTKVNCYRTWLTYLVHYGVTCYNGQCHCTDDASYYPCAYTTCECDRKFANCLKAAGSLNPKYKFYNRNNC